MVCSVRAVRDLIRRYNGRYHGLEKHVDEMAKESEFRVQLMDLFPSPKRNGKKKEKTVERKGRRKIGKQNENEKQILHL